MSTASDTSPAGFDVAGHFKRKKRMALATPAVILAYFVYIFFAFDIPGLAERARLDNARILVADSYSYKTHVTRDNRTGGLTVAVEGERKGTWPEGRSPDWVDIVGEGGALVTLKGGHEVLIEGDRLRYDVPGYGLIVAEVSRRDGVDLSLPTETPPDWISVSSSRVNITTEAGRVSLDQGAHRGDALPFRLGTVLVHARQPVPRQELLRSRRTGGVGRAAGRWQEQSGVHDT